jgi:6-hydroxycyclohex-1-ene-1-carbonyl-CoA dehydrogenase
MKAAVFTGSSKLEIRDVSVPRPGAGEILVKVAACGLCHTDLHYLDHGVPTFQKPPLVLGHEISGVVAEAGEGVRDWKAGDRVLVPPVLTCGFCEMCRRGRENICRNMRMLGNHRDGGFAEFMAAPAKDCVRLPEGIPLEEASIISDAVSTGYHAAVIRGDVQPGERVAVIGCGGVGMNVVQAAAMRGAHVTAVDLDDGKLETAMALGASAAFNPKGNAQAAKDLRKAAGSGMDAAFEVIGKPETQRLAFDCLRPGGRLILVGYSDRDFSLPAGKVMFFEMDVRGSLGCRPADYGRIVSLVAAGKLKVKELVTSRHALANINEGYDLLRQGLGLRAIAVP